MALQLNARETTIAAARHWVVRQATDAGLKSPLIPVVALLSSELITNALLHGPPRGLVTVRFLSPAATVRVEVDDSSSTPPVLRQPDRSTIGGRGLILIETYAHAWGWGPRGKDGKTVWFSLAR